MKASLAALAGVLVFASCPWALAASSVDLAVTGSITPSACVPSISSNGVVDYGKISIKDLDPSLTILPKTTFQLGVNCESASLFALASLDNRSPTQTPTDFYKLGVVSPVKWHGAYFLQVENAITEDPLAYAMYSTDNGATWHGFNAQSDWAPRALTAIGRSFMGVAAPVPIKDMSLDLIVEPFIYGTDHFPVSGPLELDGSATFELRYL